MSGGFKERAGYILHIMYPAPLIQIPLLAASGDYYPSVVECTFGSLASFSVSNFAANSFPLVGNRPSVKAEKLLYLVLCLK